MIWHGLTGEARVQPAWLLSTFTLALAALTCCHGAETPGAGPFVWNRSLASAERQTQSLGPVNAGGTYRLLVSLDASLSDARDRLDLTLNGAGSSPIRKTLHGGDPDFYLLCRPMKGGTASLAIVRSNTASKVAIKVRIEWAPLDLSAQDSAAFEAEPNDSWKQANELRLGRDVYGSADDVDYLENPSEGKSGLDWFRFEVGSKTPILVYFQLDLLDRDVSANLRLYTVDPKTSKVVPYLQGKDPMEIVHDRERERYSKHVSRTFSAGTYYLEVNANHPDYILRTRVLPVPPYKDADQAVEAGMHYIMNVGDAWFAQIPREGNIYSRSANMHDTATRCTACHASSFSTEANLVAHKNGYPIRSKSNFQYVIDRIDNSITPLYGDDGLFWQRFIAIPLQSQGKQGGILLDYERQIAGPKTTLAERFAPFLRKAWELRTDLPPDEQNGVIPLDSKFGFAWRDANVLSQIATRNGNDADGRVAKHILDLVGSRAGDLRVENLQDRIHRLYAWSRLDRAAFANKIKRETGALLALQNGDGGWYELDTGPGASAVYTTGQLVWTLIETGLPRDHPAIKKAVQYLLAQQQDFGGWFQATTHENFRTPMRETRYAVMALASAVPRGGVALGGTGVTDPGYRSGVTDPGYRSGRPLIGWGNRDEQPARLPRRDTLLHTLDDLENLWDVLKEDRPGFARAVIALLEHEEPLVRAGAASCLGRLGDPQAVGPLVKRLNDPSKIVWRAAAWALRHLGNRGIGTDAILAALSSPDAQTRRGAARIFAYQFHGMDTRLDMAARLVDLTADTDLLTRLQALRTLRQWFYRTTDTAFSRRIINIYLARMAQPDVAVIRRNLSEGLYIMLDENLGGGTSLQKNLEQLPVSTRQRVLDARKEFERSVLLEPVLAALENGSKLQREALLQAFDGSFFKGRAFARQPEGMIDVGNDREFGFLEKPAIERLELVFQKLLIAELSPTARRQALELASFFQVPGRSKSAQIQLAILARLRDSDDGVRSAARGIIATELETLGAERDPIRLDAISDALGGSEEDRKAILQAIGRNEQFSGSPALMPLIRRLINRADSGPSLLPILRWPLIRDAEALALILHAWPRLDSPQRVQAVEMLFRRPSLVDQEEPREPVLQVLRLGIHDASPSVRSRSLRGINALPNFWGSKRSNSLVISALVDDSPAIRHLALSLATTKPGFWGLPEVQEHLKSLLIDPDPKIRLLALATAERFSNFKTFPALARRVKSLEGDPVLGRRAIALLEIQRLDPAVIEADVKLGQPRLLSVATFRRKVNPLFYQPAEDGHSCASCHANHTVLRVAERSASAGSSTDSLMTNFNAALKVVNLGDPESSLILRKPRSPQGQGEADADSPTGVTHVGGPRWDGIEHPAYRAILEWIREAQTSGPGAVPAQRLSADSYSPDYEPRLAADGRLDTVWQTEFVGASPGYPHELSIDLGSVQPIEGLLYVPRQDADIGRVKDYEIHLSLDGKTFGPTVASGRWSNDATYKYAVIPTARARFIQLRGLNEVEGRTVMSAAEIVIETTPTHSH